MTTEQHEMLKRINEYAEEVMPDIDPQKTQISYQLEMLKPIMQKIADEKGVEINDVFIEYMDLASEAALDMENKLQESLKDIEDDDKK
ncbi:MAG: hypothetical protein K6G43_11055 [Lachnospiraceae bacterium]|nr:hypothetical protein [Lachnospiraceae bacterium]